MQFDAIETGLLRANRRVSEQTRQHLRKILDVRSVHVGDAFAIAEPQRFQFIRRQHAGELVFAHGAQADADFGIG